MGFDLGVGVGNDTTDNRVGRLVTDKLDARTLTDLTLVYLAKTKKKQEHLLFVGCWLLVVGSSRSVEVLE